MAIRRRRLVAPMLKVPVPFNPLTGKYATLGKPPEAGARVALFTVLAEYDDYLVCEGFDPETQKWYDELAVAKPFLLQRTPFDGETVDYNGTEVTYSYLDSTTRVAAREDKDDVVQQLVPAYYAGELLGVMRTRSAEEDATGMVRADSADGNADGSAVVWGDVNTGGRTWSSSDLSAGLLVLFAIIRDEAVLDSLTIPCDLYTEQFGAAANGDTPATGMFVDPSATNISCIKETGYFQKGELVAVALVDGEYRMQKIHSSALRYRISEGQIGVGRKKYLPIFDAAATFARWESLGVGQEHPTANCNGYVGSVSFVANSSDATYWAILSSDDQALLASVDANKNPGVESEWNLWSIWSLVTTGMHEPNPSNRYVYYGSDSGPPENSLSYFVDWYKTYWPDPTWVLVETYSSSWSPVGVYTTTRYVDVPSLYHDSRYLNSLRAVCAVPSLGNLPHYYSDINGVPASGEYVSYGSGSVQFNFSWS